MSITYCISHKEDVDGLSSAILIKSAFKKCTIILVDYANLINSLRKLVSSLPSVEHGINRIFICDLGLNKKNEQKFLELLEKMIMLGYKVTYIDHHDVSTDIKKEILKRRIKLIHSIDECTSVQVYEKFKKKYSSHASFFAAAGALTDYMENRPLASQLVAKYDKQFLMLESTVFSYIISSNQNNEPFLCDLVDLLSTMKFPHEVKDGFQMAENFAKKVANAVRFIEKEIVIKDNLAFVQNNAELASSMIVNFVLGSSNKPVALAYKFKKDIDSYILSIRGSNNCTVHLGRLVNQLSTSYGGSGGGHDKACGAVIPKNHFDKFIESFDNSLNSKPN